MIPPDHELLLLDTNALIQISRDNEVGRRIQQRLSLSERREKPLISIVTVGEGLALARKWGWGPAKVSALREMYRQLVVVDVSQGDIVERYAEISAHAEAKGRSLGDNDRWIAATAQATSAWLVTTDKDFTFLEPDFIRQVYFDPAGG